MASDATEIDLDVSDLERLEDPTIPEIHIPPVSEETPAEEVVDVMWRGAGAGWSSRERRA